MRQEPEAKAGDSAACESVIAIRPLGATKVHWARALGQVTRDSQGSPEGGDSKSWA